MSINSTDTMTAATVEADEVETTEAPTEVVYEKGTWQAAMQRSAKLYEKVGHDKKRAGILLWQGGAAAIAEWEADSDSDVNAEGLAANLLAIMGTARKGDVSKIKTVALAVRNKGLQTSLFPNLSKAYAEATRLTKTAAAEADEDSAADEAVAAIEAPHSTTTAEGAARLLLAQGVSEAIRLIFDALNGPAGGDQNHAAHRAFVREAAHEAAGRVKPVTKTVDADADKTGAVKAEVGTTPKAKPVAAGSKPKPAKKAAAPKATPSVSKGDPNKKALPAKKAAAPVEAAASDNGESAGDLFDDVLGDEAPAKRPAVKRPAVSRA